VKSFATRFVSSVRRKLVLHYVWTLCVWEIFILDVIMGDVGTQKLGVLCARHDGKDYSLVQRPRCHFPDPQLPRFVNE